MAVIEYLGRSGRTSVQDLMDACIKKYPEYGDFDGRRIPKITLEGLYLIGAIREVNPQNNKDKIRDYGGAKVPDRVLTAYVNGEGPFKR